MFADEARFGSDEPSPALLGSPKCETSGRLAAHPRIHLPLGAVSPMDGACAFLILPAADTECFQIFLDTMGKRFSRQHILLILDGAPNHTTDDLLIPANITLEFLPPCSPELNPQENIWDEIREKIFKNYALKSMDKV